MTDDNVIDRAAVRFAEEAVSECGAERLEIMSAAMMLVDASLLVLLAHHKPGCAVQLVGDLTGYMTDQVRAAAGFQETRQ